MHSDPFDLDVRQVGRPHGSGAALTSHTLHPWSGAVGQLTQHDTLHPWSGAVGQLTAQTLHPWSGAVQQATHQTMHPLPLPPA